LHDPSIRGFQSPRCSLTRRVKLSNGGGILLASHWVNYRGGATIFGGDFFAVDVVVESFHA